jgi:hypothetical protein
MTWAPGQMTEIDRLSMEHLTKRVAELEAENKALKERLQPPRDTPTPEFIVGVLGAQLKESRKANELLHRRVQRLEGIDEHVKKMREGYGRNEKHIRNNAARKIVFWKRLYREGVDQIRASGTSDAMPGEPAHFREGRLNKMIERLVAEREDARRQVKIGRSALGHISVMALWGADATAKKALEMMDDPKAALP